ncbi:MAG: SoxR reducing system RseC family protein [Eubacteriaceae bacterium]|nr:SoxR reducing system RseC family protein [Eubacteriaceae bacterium]
MREKALVTKLKDNNIAVVEVKRSTACESCGACSVGKDKLIVSAEVINTVGAQVGDEVDVEMEFSGVLGASFIMYGTMFASVMAGCILGFYGLSKLIPLNENLLGFITGAVFLGIDFLVIKALDKKGTFGEKFKIRIID